MEFLVHIEIVWPADKPTEEREQIFAQELAPGQELARAGALRRLWRIPGRWANWSLYDVADATALHEALIVAAALPVDGHRGAPARRPPQRPATARHRTDPTRPRRMPMRLLALDTDRRRPDELEPPPGSLRPTRPRRHPGRAAGPTRAAVRSSGSDDDVARLRGGAGLERTPPSDPCGFDAFLPDCVLDPAVHRGPVPAASDPRPRPAGDARS